MEYTIIFGSYNNSDEFLYTLEGLEEFQHLDLQTDMSGHVVGVSEELVNNPTFKDLAQSLGGTITL